MSDDLCSRILLVKDSVIELVYLESKRKYSLNFLVCACVYFGYYTGCVVNFSSEVTT